MNEILINEIKTIVCTCCKVRVDQFDGVHRFQNIVMARKLFAYILKKEFNFGCSQIARLLNQHHTNVSYNYRKIVDFISINDKVIISTLNDIYSRMKAIENVKDYTLVTLQVSNDLILKYGITALKIKFNTFAKENL
jgi:chromosomal replication initiation ATPase DnaA